MKVPTTSSSILLATALATGTAMAAPATTERRASEASLRGRSYSLSRAAQNAESDQSHQVRGLGDLLGSLPILGEALCDPTLGAVLAPVLDLLGLKPGNCGSSAEAASLLSSASNNIPKLSAAEANKLRQAVQLAVDTISKNSGNVVKPAPVRRQEVTGSAVPSTFNPSPTGQPNNDDDFFGGDPFFDDDDGFPSFPPFPAFPPFPPFPGDGPAPAPPPASSSVAPTSSDPLPTSFDPLPTSFDPFPSSSMDPSASVSDPVSSSMDPVSTAA